MNQSSVSDHAPSIVEGKYHLCQKSPITTESTISRTIKTNSNFETRNYKSKLSAHGSEKENANVIKIHAHITEKEKSNTTVTTIKRQSDILDKRTTNDNDKGCACNVGIFTSSHNSVVITNNSQ